MPANRQTPQTKSNKSGGFNPQDYVQGGITLEEVRDTKITFDLFDGDMKGQIEPAELLSVLRNMGYQAQSQTVANIMNAIDADMDGGISFQEFLSMVSTRCKKTESRQDCKKVFDMIDDDRNGRIGISNLLRVSKELGEMLTEDEVQEMINRADHDQKNYVTPEDFYNVITRRSFV